MKTALLAQITGFSPFPNKWLVSRMRCTASKSTAPTRTITAVMPYSVMRYYLVTNVKTDKFQREPGTTLGTMHSFYPIQDEWQ
jgi:hypothetical protein